MALSQRGSGMRPFIGGLLLGLSMFTQTASPQDRYPTRPIEIVVPYGPGGGTDLMARALAKYATEQFKIQVNVLNRPGASGLIGIREALAAKPDGYTLLADTHGASEMVGAFNEPADVPFDWRKRTWIAMVDKDPVLFLVKDDSPFKSLKDVVDYVLKNPSSLRWGSSGRGSVAVPAIQQLFKTVGVPDGAAMSQVLFKSGGEVIVALAGGHIDFSAQQLAESYSMLESKKVRALAVINDARFTQFPDVRPCAKLAIRKLKLLDGTGFRGHLTCLNTLSKYGPTLLIAV